MDFVETMAEYLDGYRLDWDNTLTRKLERIEKTYPGFSERYKIFGKEVDRFREETSEEIQDSMLVWLLREGFVIDGIFEEDQLEQWREKLESATAKAREFKSEDIGLTRKEE